MALKTRGDEEKAKIQYIIHLTKLLRILNYDQRFGTTWGKLIFTEQLVTASLFRIKGHIIFKDQQSRVLLECL